MTREEAIDCINAIHVQMFNSGNSKWTEACDMAIADMKEMDRLAKAEPVLIEPQRPHGEWIFKNDNPLIPTGYWECSICKTGRLMVEENFCPNCGCRMSKEGDEK